VPSANAGNTDIKHKTLIVCFAESRGEGKAMNRPKSAKRLTNRRRQVAALVCQGLSNREIAEKLGVAEGTVKIHLHGIYEKLDISNRTELARALTDHSRVKA
jgi:DNA-binding NarL/FixJ family response regulator